MLIAHIRRNKQGTPSGRVFKSNAVSVSCGQRKQERVTLKVLSSVTDDCLEERTAFSVRMVHVQHVEAERT